MTMKNIRMTNSVRIEEMKHFMCVAIEEAKTALVFYL